MRNSCSAMRSHPSSSPARGELSSEASASGVIEAPCTDVGVFRRRGVHHGRARAFAPAVVPRQWDGGARHVPAHRRGQERVRWTASACCVRFPHKRTAFSGASARAGAASTRRALPCRSAFRSRSSTPTTTCTRRPTRSPSTSRPSTTGLIKYVEVNGRTKIALKNTISEYIPNPTFNKVAPPGAQELEFRLKNPSVDMAPSRAEEVEVAPPPKYIVAPPAFFEPEPRAWS